MEIGSGLPEAAQGWGVDAGEQPVEALAAYEASSKREPNRFRTLAGAARAAEQSGDTVKAKAYYAELTRLAKNSDGTRPELKRAKDYLAQR